MEEIVKIFVKKRRIIFRSSRNTGITQEERGAGGRDGGGLVTKKEESAPEVSICLVTTRELWYKYAARGKNSQERSGKDLKNLKLSREGRESRGFCMNPGLFFRGVRTG
ncbi:MAG TPA: hypothetical protein VGJ94_19760 [Syntrophorhabdaceae bacterium]|jgi:hypothetical protein